MVSPVSANVLLAADLLSSLPSESSVVNRKMLPRDSSEDSLSACDQLEIYGTRQRLSSRGERERRPWAGPDWPFFCLRKAINNACMYELGPQM